MLMTAPPIAVYHRDSARVEHRGPAPVDGGDRDRVGRRPVRRLRSVLLGVGEKGIQPGTADHGEVGEDGHGQTLTGMRTAGYRADMALTAGPGPSAAGGFA